MVAAIQNLPPQCGRPRFDRWVGKIPWRKAWQPIPVFLPGESPGTEEPGGLQSMGVTKSKTRPSDQKTHRENINEALLQALQNALSPGQHQVTGPGLIPGPPGHAGSLGTSHCDPTPSLRGRYSGSF